MQRVIAILLFLMETIELSFDITAERLEKNPRKEMAFWLGSTIGLTVLQIIGISVGWVVVLVWFLMRGFARQFLFSDFLRLSPWSLYDEQLARWGL